MLITLMKSKIHRATVTEANLDYVGSITLDPDLLEAAHLHVNEKVQICNVTNGNRLETYTIHGERGSGVVCINGAAAHLVAPGDLVIIISFAQMTPEEAEMHLPEIVFVDANNKIVEKSELERHGESKGC
ncbi:MAG: aspartate 1-decarboxylase [Clostridia bacterium]